MVLLENTKQVPVSRGVRLDSTMQKTLTEMGVWETPTLAQTRCTQKENLLAGYVRVESFDHSYRHKFHDNTHQKLMYVSILCRATREMTVKLKRTPLITSLGTSLATISPEEVLEERSLQLYQPSGMSF